MPNGKGDEKDAENDMEHEPGVTVAAAGAFGIAMQDQARERKGQGRQPGHHGGEGPRVEGFFIGIHNVSFPLERICHPDGSLPEAWVPGDPLIKRNLLRLMPIK
jgi:hypothetical protein